MHTARISLAAIALVALSCAPAPTAPMAPMAPMPAAKVAPTPPAWFVPGLELPVSTSALQPPAGIPVLTLTRTELWFEGKVVAHIAADPTKGFDAEEKTGGANGMHIAALIQALKSTPKPHRADASYLIAGDRRITYRTLVEVLASASQAGFTPPFLATGSAHAIRVDLPDVRVGGAAALPMWQGVILTAVAGSHVKVQDHCNNCVSSRTGDSFAWSDTQNLQAKLTALRTEHKQSAASVIVSASGDTAYAAIVQLADFAADAGFTPLRLGITW